MKVEQILAELREAADRLAADHPDLAADERAWIDTLDGETTGIDLAEHLAERCLHLQALEAAATERAKALRARADRFEAEQVRLKALILALVDAAGGKKIVRPGVTISPRAVPPKVLAVDPAATPPQYMRTVTTSAPDRAAISEALAMGAQVDGWMRTNGGRVVALLVR